MTAVIPGEHIWLSDAEQGFLPCLVTEAIKPGDAGKSVDVMLPDGRTQRREVTRKEAEAVDKLAAEQATLPTGWRAVMSRTKSTGRVYYIHAATKRRQWQHPSIAAR